MPGSEPQTNGDLRADISISLLLTERTLVKEVDAVLHVQRVAEPKPPEPVMCPAEMYVNGELVSKWQG